MKSWKIPTTEQVDKAVSMLGRTEQSRYFFDRLNNPHWIRPLKEKGIFHRPPQLESDGNRIRIPPWPASEYLARVAGDAADPSFVTDTIISVPETDNSRVRSDLVKAAMKLPGSEAARLTEKVIAWIDTPYNISLHETIGQFMSYLASSNEVRKALQIARALLAIAPKSKTGKTADTDKEYFISTKPETRISLSDYQSILEDNLAILTANAGHAIIELLCQLLATAFKASSDTDDEYSYIWRPAIEDHEQNHDDSARGLLISSIRDAAEQVLREHPTDLLEILRLLRRSRLSDDSHPKPGTTIERICLHLIRLFPTGNESEVAQALRNKALFEDHRLRHEYALLLKEQFQNLSPPDQETILRWIDYGPSDIEERSAGWSKERGGPPSAEEIAGYKKHWQMKQLALIQNSLPESWAEKYAAIASGMRPPEHPEFESYVSSGYVGYTSPRTLEDLKAMPFSELREFLRSWTPEARGLGQGPTRAGLGKMIEDMVSLEPRKYTDSVELFYGLDPTYVRSFLEGIGQALAKDRHFPWMPVLDLCQWAVNQERSIPGRKIDRWTEDTDWGWTRARILRLLSAGFDEGSNQLPFETRTKVWSILSTLTEDPDPTEDEKDREHRDEGHHLQRAINTVRGRAMEAVIEYGLWVRKHLNVTHTADKPFTSSFQLMPEVRQVLDKHLDQQSEHSLAIRAIYGTWFPWLALLDREWTEENTSEIFPPDRADIWDASWESYILFREPYNDALPLLNSTYMHAILTATTTQVRGNVPKTQSHLAQHLMTFYWRGLLGIEPGGLIHEFFARSQDEVRAEAIEFLGRSVKHVEHGIPGNLLEKLLALWSWRLSAIKQHPVTSSKEAAAFGWWFGSGKFDHDWSIRQVITILHLTHGQIDPDYLVMEQLAELSPELTKETIQCAALMVEGDKDGWDISSWTKELRQILGVGAASKNIETQRQTSALINRLGERGYLTYRELLPKL
jgi:hypothetical protein